jgi:hypothetical protein
VSNSWLDIIVIGALLLVGAFISLPALLRPVRRSCQRRLAARGAVLCVLGLVSFVIGFGGLTRLEAQATYIFGTIGIVDFEPEEARVTRPPEANEPFVVRELWVRLLLPPPLRQRCYTSEAWVCAEADKLVPATSECWGWSSYWLDVGLGSVSVVANSMLVWLFTRRRR